MRAEGQMSPNAAPFAQHVLVSIEDACRMHYRDASLLEQPESFKLELPAEVPSGDQLPPPFSFSTLTRSMKPAAAQLVLSYTQRSTFNP